MCTLEGIKEFNEYLKKELKGKMIKFMKVDGQNGINIDESTYNKYDCFIIEFVLNKITQDFRIIIEEVLFRSLRSLYLVIGNI